MSRLLTPTFRISIGLVGLTISLILSAYVFGLLPDERKIELEARAKIAEALAVQLSNAASRNNIKSLKETMDSVVKSNGTILSIALRRSTGELQISAGDHDQHWVEPDGGRSTPTHVQITLMNGGEIWGKIEFVFKPLEASGLIAGIPNSLAGFIGFLAVLGFVGYYLMLRRALRELDPGNVIPDRVQAAFNTLAEGVLILDERGFILLANNSFAKAIDKTSKDLFGSKIGDLRWQQSGEDASIAEHPWQIAIRDQKHITGVRMEYSTSTDNFRIFMVNATCILDDNDVASGVIVTFDDVTALEQKNDDLILAVRKLQKSEKEISHQNRELQYLADHDPLTGCLNRRAFFAKLAIEFESANKAGHNLTCLMVDLDHFKSVNDNFGHGIGDDVIAGMAEILKSTSRDKDLVGRYGGEEFCVALIDSSRDESQRFGDKVREQMISLSPGWLNCDQIITASLGVANLQHNTSTVKDIVNWADKALYEAKETGRNKVVFWDQTPEFKSAIADEVADTKKVETTLQEPVASLDENVDQISESPKQDVVNFSPAKTQSLVDPLTKLPSILIFKDRISQSILRAERNNKYVAILQIAPDYITSLTSDTAHQELIGFFSARFSSILRQSDTISLFDGGNKVPTLSRATGDTFLVELSDLDNDNTIPWVVKRLFQSLNAPFTIDGEEVYAACDIGISIYPNDGRDVDTLIHNANIAQQHANGFASNNNFQFYSAEMNEHSHRQLALESGIRQSLRDNEFALFFQPIVDATSGRLKSMETLLRCNNPIFSGMPIGMIISIAEQSGLMIEIGEWVTRTAIYQAERWIASGLELPGISVNLSTSQLGNSEAMERIMQIILMMDLPPKKLQFEVTEAAILKDVEAAGQALMHLQQLGVMIALDDFGTGQSSLSYLRRFRPDILKIDRCFIGEITTNLADETLVSAIVSMSQKMGLRVVAEGVETIAQLDKVRDMGCDEIQGFYIAKPMPVDTATDWLQSIKHVDIINAAKHKKVIVDVA